MEGVLAKFYMNVLIKASGLGREKQGIWGLIKKG